VNCSRSYPSTSPRSDSKPHPHEIIASSPELGGDIIHILTGPEDDDDEGGFLTALGVPTFAVIPSRLQSMSRNDSFHVAATDIINSDPKRQGLEAILQNSNAFLIKNALTPLSCDSIIDLCEQQLKFGNFNAGKNNHGAMQIVIPKEVSDKLLTLIGPHVDLTGVVESEKDLGHDGEEFDNTFSMVGINRRCRVYRYAPNRKEQFAPHIDAGFPPGGVSLDYEDEEKREKKPTLLWDAADQYSKSAEVVSRLTVLIYLNDDFSGGHTKFYSPLSETSRASKWDHDALQSAGDDRNVDKKEEDYEGQVIASIRPRAGSILVFPQAVGEDAVERARYMWPLHEGSPVTSGRRPKYVIRTDVLFETNSKEDTSKISEQERVLFQHDDVVRQVFLPRSPMFSPLFLHHVNPLYNPHMGVENAGPLLYSLVRFTKCRNIVEVGAGYTTLFILQALKDNENEMKRVVNLNKEGRLRLLDYPFGTPVLNEWERPLSLNSSSFSLLCIDNCLHQRQTASSAIHVARTLGLDSYLQFLQGDAFDALDSHFSQSESIDLLWCDFGVGSRMAEYAARVWKFLKPGGFLACHSTLTNARTRDWLEAVRAHKGTKVTGIPANEYSELSLLEPHKRFQNSITILQKRAQYEEPIYSEYA